MCLRKVKKLREDFIWIDYFIMSFFFLYDQHIYTSNVLTIFLTKSKIRKSYYDPWIPYNSV